MEVEAPMPLLTAPTMPVPPEPVVVVPVPVPVPVVPVPVPVPVPVLPTPTTVLPRPLPLLRERVTERLPETVGKYWETSSPIMARATMKFSYDCLMFWLLRLSCLSSSSSCGSWKIFHHSPRRRPSFGSATFQPSVPRNWVEDSL